MVTVSSCLIVKNEKENIKNCLDCIMPFSDEIIIYDTGSDDGTQEICKQYDKVKVIQGEWRDDFAWARNQSFSYANCDYIFWIDADDIIPESTIRKICELKSKDFFNNDIVAIKYDYTRDQEKGIYYYRERFVKRSLGLKWRGKIHESIKVGGDYSTLVLEYEYHIKHNKVHPVGDRNIKIYKKMELMGEKFSPLDLVHYGRELMMVQQYGAAKEKLVEAIDSKSLNNTLFARTCIDLAAIYDYYSDKESTLQWLLRAVPISDIPRPDVCCMLGDTYKKYENYEMALMWYDCALLTTKLDQNPRMGDFITTDMFTTYPSLNACVCAHRMGNINAAIRYNNYALSIDPTNEYGISNKKFFDSLLAGQNN